jgi:HSP20 family molecular chaperone IbpA
MTSAHWQSQQLVDFRRQHHPSAKSSESLKSPSPGNSLHSFQNCWLQNQAGLMQWNNANAMPCFSFIQTQETATQVIVQVGVAAHLAEELEIWVMPKMVLLRAEQMDAIAHREDSDFSVPSEVFQGLVPLPCLVDPEQSTASLYAYELVLSLPKLSVTHSTKIRGSLLIPNHQTRSLPCFSEAQDQSR